MRKRLEPEERKRAIAEAVLSVTARGGLDAASVRDVAAEAGVSAGMVQHHFGTKDEMLLFACGYMVEKSGAAMGEKLAALTEPITARDRLRAFFEQAIPSGEDRKREVRVWISFLARAVVKPDLEVFMRDTHASSHRYIAENIRAGQKSGEIPSTLNSEREAMSIFMFVEGLTSHVLLGHYTPDQAMQAVDEHLDALFSDDRANHVP